MQHLDDGTIHAWLDGALGAVQAQQVEEHVAACRACADRVAEARGLIAASSRILMVLDDVPAGVVPIERPAAVAAARVASPAFATAAAPTPEAAQPRTRWGHRYGRIAAVLAFVAAGTLVLTREANRRDLFVKERTVTPPHSAQARRDVAPQVANAPTAAPRAVPEPAPARERHAVTAAAPTPALGGGAKPSPAAPPSAKPFAALRANAASALEAPSPAGRRQLGDVNKTADTTALGLQAQKPAPAAKRLEVASQSGAPGGSALSSVRGRPAPRLVSVDSVQRGSVMVRREIYAIGDNQQIVLEATPAASVPKDSLADAAVLSPATIAPAAVTDSSTAAVHVIRWRGADGTGYTLSGPVSVDELQRIRAALGKD